MKGNDFFKKQTALTAAKTKIYKEYIEGYLPKLLMTYGTCLIADLFCGAGKNGNENGSPLILIDRLNYILSSQQLQKKDNLEVHVLFNDEDERNIDNLRKELEKADYDKKIIKVYIKNEKYENILPELVRKPEKMRIPKFFFLDPFTYSNVKMQDLKKIMSLDKAEILLFIPIFFTYRFSNKEFDKTHNTQIFIKEYTTKGVTDYKNIHFFMASVREKLLQEISIPYVRDVLLDGGGSKNSLFLLTKHKKAMLLMNKIAFKMTDNGSSIILKNEGVNSLFQINEVSLFYDSFRKELIDLFAEKELTNNEIVDFAIKSRFLPKHAKQEIKELHNSKKIRVFDENNKEITDARKWNIADIITKKVIFKWISNEKT